VDSDRRESGAGRKSLVGCAGREASAGHPRPLVRPLWPLNGRPRAALKPCGATSQRRWRLTEAEVSISSSVVSLKPWGAWSLAKGKEHIL
jgi:hypothetical protein